MASKGPEAFRTISEVAGDLELPQHVLRFWETRFTQIKPMKRGGGRRYYRPDDVELLRGIRSLLYSEGYTIRGVQRLLKEHGPRFVVAAGRGDGGMVARDEDDEPVHRDPAPQPSPRRRVAAPAVYPVGDAYDEPLTVSEDEDLDFRAFAPMRDDTGEVDETIEADTAEADEADAEDGASEDEDDADDDTDGDDGEDDDAADDDEVADRVEDEDDDSEDDAGEDGDEDDDADDDDDGDDAGEDADDDEVEPQAEVEERVAPPVVSAARSRATPTRPQARPMAQGAGSFPLTRDDIRRLTTTLSDLLELKRRLDQAR